MVEIYNFQGMLVASISDEANPTGNGLNCGSRELFVCVC